MDIGRDKYQSYVGNADAPPDHASLIRTITHSAEAARTKIFTPRGKRSMLQGGIGCVRYKSLDKKSGGKAWFMSAASRFAPDEGVPLLVPDTIYQRLIDRIREDGFAPATLRGHVRFIPIEFRDVYSTRHGIPRLYVDVDEAVDAAVVSQGFGEVSVAASFATEIDGETAICAAYATFDPGHRGARRSAIDWMSEEYVRGLYGGEMLTDFDQQSPSFSDTLFSLDDVMTSPDLAAVILRLRKTFGRFDWSMLERQNINFAVDRRDMRMEVNIGGNAQNVVIGGHGSSNRLVIKQAQLQEFTNELGVAKQALKAEPDSDERDRIVGAIADAEVASKDGDQAGITGALKRLMPFKDKVIAILEKAGAEMVVSAIKAAVGL